MGSLFHEEISKMTLEHFCVIRDSQFAKVVMIINTTLVLKKATNQKEERKFEKNLECNTMICHVMLIKLVKTW